MQQFRGGLVFEADRLCVSPNSRPAISKEEEVGVLTLCFLFRVSCFLVRNSGFGIRDAGSGIRNSGFGFPDSVFAFQDYRISVKGLEFSGITGDPAISKPAPRPSAESCFRVRGVRV